MAELDYTLATWIRSNAVIILLGILGLIFLKKYGSDFRHRYFAWFMSAFSKKKDKDYEKIKKELFSTLYSTVSHDPELRKIKSIKILEIGVGTGVNFSHYPDGSHLVVVDPNPHFSKYYNENRFKFPNIHSEEINVVCGEDMHMVPDNSVDAVVMTLVMCSVKDVVKILRQVQRVLAPGGKFFFLEHIKEWDHEKHGLRQNIQELLSQSKIWPFFFDGCFLNRDMLIAIETTGFAKVESERFYAPIKSFFFRVIQPHLKGIATK